LLVFLLHLHGLLYAQVKTYTISGKVQDSLSKASIDYATVTVFKPGNTMPVGGALTDAKGGFKIDIQDSGLFTIRVEFIGYHSKTFDKVLLSPLRRTADLGKIFLSTGRKTLQNVEVRAKKNFVENHIDKIVYNAEKDISSQTGMAPDVLKKVPQVSVDINGNVELQGNANVKVLINGKPSAMFDNNLAEALQTIPANMIKSIEVITSPGAKYDAEGTAGIINIILKDNTSQGVNGNINITTGSLLQSASGNLHIKKGKWDINLSLFGNVFLKSTTLYQLSRSSDSLLFMQNGRGNLQRNAYKPQANFTYAINHNSSLGGNFNYNNYGNINDGNNRQWQYYNYDSAANTQNNRFSDNRFRNRIADWGLNYHNKMAHEGEELSAYLQQTFINNSSSYTQDQFNSVNTHLSGAMGTNQIQDIETYITADYTRPFKNDEVLEMGTKETLSRISSTSAQFIYNSASDVYLPAGLLSDDFKYNRNVYAAYLSFSTPLTKALGIKLGIRDEYTDNHLSFTGIAQPIASYNSFIPSFTIANKWGKGNTLKLSISGRIQRPSYRDLNPFINAADPLNVTQGNPGLSPERTVYAEMSYSKFYDKGGSFIINLFYRHTGDDEQGYIKAVDSLRIGDSVYHNVSVSTQVNAGLQQMMGSSMFGTLPLGKMDIRANVLLLYKYINSSLVSGGVATGFVYRGNVNVSYAFTNDISAEAFGNYQSPHAEMQGKFPGFYSYSFALRKFLWNKKASIALTTTNPFNEYTNQVTNITGLNFVLQSTNSVPYRSFGLNFNYKFGRLEYKEKKEDKDANGEDN
jgi:hypothetical protein